MKTSINIFILIFTIVVCTSSSSAQSGFVSSGSHFSNSNGDLSYSTGQIVFETISSSDGSASQGIQQTYTITVSVHEPNLDIAMDIYPNPTTDQLYLKCNDCDDPQIKYALYDNTGHQVLKSSNLKLLTVLDLSSFSASTYVLVISKNNKKIKDFKIIKH